MISLLKFVILGTVITAARGRVTPGLCFELRLSTGGRYQKNLAHQLEAIGPLLAAGVRQQPAAIVATQSPPLPYFEGAFRAVFPGTALVKGPAPAGLCRTTKTFSGSGGQNKNFGIGPAAKELKRRAYASCNKTLAPPPPLTKPTIVHLARGVIREGMNTRRLVNANASIATLLKTFPKATVVERATRGGETPFCGQLDTYDAATVVLTPHGAHLVLAIFAPVNTIVLEAMPWDMWRGGRFVYGSASKYLSGVGLVFDRVRTVRPLHPSTYNVNVTGHTRFSRFKHLLESNGKIRIQGRFSPDPWTIDLNHLAAVAAKAKGRLAGAERAAAASRAAVAAALKKRAALRQNPKCIALDESVRAGKGTCKPGKGIFCNARHRCYGNSACALCEP